LKYFLIVNRYVFLFTVVGVLFEVGELRLGLRLGMLREHFSLGEEVFHSLVFLKEGLGL
jgi:hypothetical protein